MRFFKYMPKKYLAEFFNTGSLKVGTLYEYRRVEAYGNVIGDGDEGTHKTELSIRGGAEISLGTSSAEAAFFRNLVLPHQRDPRLRFVVQDGTQIISQSNSPNLFLYCVTSEYDKNVMHQFGCDACMEVVWPRRFFRSISKALGSSARYENFRSIHYANRSTHYKVPHPCHPAFMKDPKYAYQNEWRAVWECESTDLKPQFLKIPQAIRYCRVHTG